jgi:hypothetical protein
MFDPHPDEAWASHAARPGCAELDRVVDAAVVRGWIEALATSSAAGRDDAGRIDLIRSLEDLKSAASASQARASVDFDASQRARQKAAGVPADLMGRGVAAQVALARRESPHAGSRFLGLAQALVSEMPHTLAALSCGVLSEWRATVLVRESACLSREDRASFDHMVAADTRALVGLGTRALAARARQVAQRLNAAALVARARRAESERCVPLRPAPDTMTYLTALLPVAQGVAAYAALMRAADAARAAGDPRGRGQVMADELVSRLATGACIHPGSGSVPGGRDGEARRPPARLEVQLVMTDRALLAGDDAPAVVPGYGTVPGPWARQLVLDALAPAEAAGPEGLTPHRARHPEPLGKVQVWVRRLFTAPTSGQLVAMEARGRLAAKGLADLIRARDGAACRTPYCDAPIRHIDHVDPAATGGPTAAANLQGVCEACNYAKEAPGCHHSRAPPRVARGAPLPADIGGSTTAPDVRITTPTGHHYGSRAPALPGSPTTTLPDSSARASDSSTRIPGTRQAA